MGADVVVDGFPFTECLVEGFDLEIAVVDIVELLDVCSVGSLNMTVELWRARGQDEEADTVGLTGVFEGGVELRAAIHLKCFDGERHPPKQSVEEAGGSGGGGSGVRLDHIPAADHVSGSEVFEHDARQGTEVEGIHLDQIPRLSDPVVSGLAYGVRPGMRAPAGADTVAGRFLEHATLLKG
jgi:hypothetical protein